MSPPPGSVTWVEVEDLLVAATRVLGHEPGVRDSGLLASAVARPQTTVFGEDAYPSLDEKAAALLHSLVRNHALDDGNKRLGWTGVALFYGFNGFDLVAPEDAAHDLVVGVAAGTVDDLAVIAARLSAWTRPLP